VNEAVDRVIEQREALDAGFPSGVAMSAAVHVVAIGLAVGSAWFSRPPRLEVKAIGFAVPLPAGGGGPLGPEPAPAVAPPVTAPPVTAPPETAPPAPEPQKVIKPPKEEPRKGIPPLEAKKTKKPKPERSVMPTRAAGPPTPERRPASSGAAGGTGTSSATPGLGIIGPAGPGAPNGTDPLGDWYLAGVQRKIWSNWTRQARIGFVQPITVSFTILADGSIEEGSVRMVQASGIQLLDYAAQRAVSSAAPFTPLPRTYGTNRITIQALFQPTP